MIMWIKKFFVILLIIIFSIFIINIRTGYTDSGKKWALPLLGASLLAGGGAYYLRKNAKEKYEEADKLYDAYVNISEKGTDGNPYPNDVYEKAYEKYEDKFAEAKQMETYTLMCLGGGVLALAGSVFLFLKPSSNKIMNIGYNIDYKNKFNDLFLNVKF